MGRLSTTECTYLLLAGVCAVGVCAWARVSAAPRHSWLGCCGVCVLVCALRLYPATPGWGVRCGCVCLGSGFGCAPPLLAGVLGCVFVCVRAPLVLRLSWLRCAAWVRVLRLGFRLRPATPSWGVGLCVRLCVRSACTPSLLAGVCGVGVRAWARVSAAARRSWLRCWVVCVLVWALHLCPPLVAGVCGVGVRAWARVLAAPRHSWLACWGVCVCLFACSACTPPLLAGAYGVDVCAWARVLAAPRQSWLGCWGVCVCLCACSACTPPLLAGPCGVGLRAWARVSAAPHHSWLGRRGVCVFVCALRWYPATPGWGLWCGCVCLGSGFGCAPPLLAGMSGGVCACVRAPLVPRHSWPGCAGAVCVLGLGFGLRPATPGLAVGVCVCLCAHFACTMPLMARLCGVGACAEARVLAAPRHSWLGC